MRTLHGILGLVLLALPGPPPRQADLDLTPAQADSIGRGLWVIKYWRVPGAPWPRVRLHQFIAASPEESAATLADYEYQNAYFKELKSARIVKRRDPANTEVAFVYDIPWAPDAEYTVLDQISRLDTSTYAISWTLVESKSVSEAEGYARFFPWRNPVTGEDGTLLSYQHFARPRSFLARLVPDRVALNAAKRATRGIAQQVEYERKSEQQRLQKQITNLRAALGH
jgi:hypothetical protein